MVAVPAHGFRCSVASSIRAPVCSRRSSEELYGAPTPIRFEGKEVMGVAHPHEYLTCTYGEYMVIPKQEHQRTHNFQYLDYHLPYREYTDNRTFVR